MLNDHYEKWNVFSPLGLLIIGLGISLIGEAIICKANGQRWFLKGTLGLIIFNTGIAIFGEAVKSRALYENELNQLRKQ